MLLNVCYEPDNVATLLRTSGVKHLVGFLLADSQELQANAAGEVLPLHAGREVWGGLS